ncbi:hypothetical protein ACSBR1_023823 [Camellia fascicularis]
MDAEGIPLEPDKMKEQPLSAKDERSVSPNASKDAGIGHSKDIADQLGPFGSCGDHHLYPSNIYAPQAQAIYYKGFENAPGEWDEYPSYVNAERLDIGSPGIYNDNPSLLFHTGYGYSPQMPYGPYSPVTTPLPSVGRDAQLYSPQQYPFSGPPYYQHLVPPSMQYITPPTPVSQPVLNSVVSIDQQVDGMLLGPRPSYPSPVTSFGRGNFSGNPGGFGFHDLQQGFDAFRTSGLWSDWSKPSDRQRALTPFSPAVSPQPIGNLGSFGQNVGMVNASAQFCGVAEMVGPVDFDKSVDYWQQDKWSGQFPVKWHIIRDVPNSQFRHIVLENNDNKPVTNSRDTQEAKLEQGIEMLKIFNNYESNMSILDDFEFYEDRQKAMQERKARQQQQQPSLVVGIGESAGNVVTTTLSSNFIQQISKSFAQVVHLEDYAKEGSDSVSVTERTTGTASDASMTNGHKLENATTVVSSTSKTS